jgi:hypothetical protein
MNSMPDLKIKVHTELANKLQIKLKDLNSMINDAVSSRDSDTKSSVGDKHETSRAKIQIEIDQLCKQLKLTEDQFLSIKSINLRGNTDVIDRGSLVRTNIGYFFLSVGYGKLVVNNIDFFILSLASPLGQLLRGKKTGDQLIFRGISYIIEDIV